MHGTPHNRPYVSSGKDSAFWYGGVGAVRAYGSLANVRGSPGEMSTNTAAIRVGRLLEIRADQGYRTVAEVGLMNAAVNVVAV